MPAKLSLKALARKALETPGELTNEEKRRLYAAALAKLAPRRKKP